MIAQPLTVTKVLLTFNPVNNCFAAVSLYDTSGAEQVLQNQAYTLTYKILR